MELKKESLITKITKKQEAHIPVIIENWKKRASSPLNKKKVLESVNKLYKLIDKSPPKVLIVDSPNAAFELAKSKYNVSDPSNLLLYNWYNWAAFYEILDYIGIKFNKKVYNVFMDIVKNLHFVIPMDKVCIVSEYPVDITWGTLNLHCDNKPAIHYKDDHNLYFLNGTQVPEKIVMTPAEHMPVEWYFEETNVEIRREIAVKLGIQRILSGLKSKKIDSRDHAGIPDMYELHIAKLFDEERTFLKMKNPSLLEQGIEHMEYVPPEVTTIEEAIMFRNGLTKEMIDPVNGVDYFQQGDVVLKPEKATKFKSIFPKILS